jgi:hypothetical protein
MALMSYRAYSRHRGCRLSAVQKAITDGRIASALVQIEGQPYPKIDSDKADALWLLNTDESKRSTLFTPSDEASGISAPMADDDFEIPGDPESDAAKKSYHQSRSLRAKIDAENAQLDLDQRKGKLIDLDEAKQLGFTTLRTLRDALRNTGPRIAAQVAALSDPFACEVLINAEIDSVLASMSVEKILTDQYDDDQDGEGD